MKERLKQLALRVAPAWLQRAAKRIYYPRLLRNFPESQWPGSGVIRRLVRRGDVVVDAGANIGYVTTLLARWTGTSGHVLSFEPVPETFNLLQNNMRKLGLAHVTLYPLALSSQEGTARMRIPDYAGGGRNYYESTVVRTDPTDRTDPSEKVIDVPTESLDTILRDRMRIAFIKIDVEGHELEVIRGAEQTIRRDRPPLYIEVSGDPSEAASRAGELFNVLRNVGYSPYRIEGPAVSILEWGQHAPDVLFLQPDHLARLRD